MEQTSIHRIRIVLLILNSGIGLTAVVGGILVLTGIVQFPLTWLSGSSSDSYRLPAVVLMAVVGGSALVAATLLLMDSKSRAFAALASGVILIGWMATEIGIIGWRFWWQPCFLGFGLLTFILGVVLQTSKQE